MSIDLKEGVEVTLSVIKASTEKDRVAFREAAGAWKDLVDCDQLIKDVHASRLTHTREEPRL